MHKLRQRCATDVNENTVEEFAKGLTVRPTTTAESRAFRWTLGEKGKKHPIATSTSTCGQNRVQ